jgi:hypothetical protein
MIRLGTLMNVLLMVGRSAAGEEKSATSPRATVQASVPASPAVAADPSGGAKRHTADQVSPKDVPSKDARSKDVPSTLKVKRLVVTTGVKDREPLSNPTVLPSDGSAIYAFAELSNPDGESENVRITFERKGGAERVGNVTLPVPAKVSRHRTWATTRFIRAAGVWEAVLWSEDGSELSRTSFEVASS